MTYFKIRIVAYSSNRQLLQIEIVIKSSKVFTKLMKTRNIVIDSSQSCDSVSKVVKTLLQDVIACKTNTENFHLLCNILETNSAKHC